MSLHATYTYFQTKKEIINEMKENSRSTIIALENNIQHFIEAYAINEYEKLVTHELEYRNIFAIVIEDYNMGKILGKKAYISGKIKNSDGSIQEYDDTSSLNKKQLKMSYYTDVHTISNDNGKVLGKIYIYISDENMKHVLNKIIQDTFLNTLLIILILAVVLFFAIRTFIFLPITQIVKTLEKQDQDGIPISFIPDSSFKEGNWLVDTMNKMIGSIKQSRFELKELNERLELAWDGVNDGIWDWNIQTNEVYFSKKWKSMLGYKDEDLENKVESFFNRIHEDDKQKVQSSLKKHFEDPKKNIYAVEFRLLCKNGKYKWILARGKARLDSKGNPIRMLGSHTDIDETKKINERIHKAEVKFHTLFQESMDAILLLELETQHFVEFNNKALELYEYTHDEFKKLTPFDITAEFDQKSMVLKQKEILEKGWDYFITKHKTKSGKIINVAIKSKKIDINGKDGLYITLHDITKEQENELKLAQSLELQTHIFENIGYFLIRTDKNGIIKQINKEGERLLGYKAEELIDKYTPEIFHSRNEVTYRAKELSEEFNVNVKPGFETFIFKSKLDLDNENEWTYINKEGQSIPIQLRISALKDHDGNIFGYLGVGQDITQRKLLESQTKLASMGEMIGNIAHQWRQPLSVISTIASGIKVKKEFGQFDINEVIPDMEHIVSQTQYLSKTIDDFRAFISNNDKKEFFSLLSTLDKTFSILHSSVVNNDITVIKNLNADIKIDGFENQLIQGLINIINNAKDAMKENVDKDSPRLLFIETKNIKNGVVLLIKDNGGGISESIMSKIFEPYFTTKHQSMGTGIGLSIAYQILKEHHHANILVHNENYNYEGKNYTGACFSIEFTQKES